MSALEVLIAVAGACATAMVIAAMILLTPSGTESTQAQQAPSGDPMSDSAGNRTSASATTVVRAPGQSSVEHDGAMT